MLIGLHRLEWLRVCTWMHGQGAPERVAKVRAALDASPREYVLIDIHPDGVEWLREGVPVDINGKLAAWVEFHQTPLDEHCSF